jgi:hypothetical protein
MHEKVEKKTPDAQIITIKAIGKQVKKITAALFTGLNLRSAGVPAARRSVVIDHYRLEAYASAPWRCTAPQVKVLHC